MRAVFTISKRYVNKAAPGYWYTYHPQWHDFLEQADRGYLVLGCMDRNEAFAIPVGKFHPLLTSLNRREKEDGSISSWYVILYEGASGELSLTLPKQKESLSLLPFAIGI